MTPREWFAAAVRLPGMRQDSAGRRTTTVAQRGQIVQRVIVDGWTAERAAAAFGVPERLVAVWVADYRRRGMASLRHAPSRTLAAEIVRRRLLLPACAACRGVANAMRRLLGGRAAPPSPLGRVRDDRREGGP